MAEEIRPSVRRSCPPGVQSPSGACPADGGKSTQRKGLGWRTLGISLALTNLLLWFSAPALCSFVDDQTGRRSNPDNPHIMNGVQELFVYFDRWLARGVFPAVYLFGFAVIPFLRKRNEVAMDAGGGTYAVAVTLLLIGLEAVWLTLIAVVVFLRGPNWNLFWPGEAWDEGKVMPLNSVNLSELFWRRWMGRPLEGMPWALRELPGLVLIGGYLLAGFVLAYFLFRWARRSTSYCRWTLLVLLLQVAALVPFKMACRWLFDLKYWIAIQEHWWNV